MYPKVGVGVCLDDFVAVAGCMSPTSENRSLNSAYLDDDKVGLLRVNCEGLCSAEGLCKGAYGCVLTGVDAFEAAELPIPKPKPIKSLLGLPLSCCDTDCDRFIIVS